MKDSYDFKSVEKKWGEKWYSSDIYSAKDNSDKPKKYILNEFPYPSGEGLHVGHAFSFTGGDVYARFMRMNGYNVLFPMGWDAFGLPAENYAIKTKRKPKDIVAENTARFKTQMKMLGYSIDWDREVNTTDPEYYKWTQWIFIKLFEKGLAYKQEIPINWCPSCKIGLANEEVVDGKCERCGAQTTRRNMSQWIVKITEYADRLIDGLRDTDFIDKVKAAQINWIDKSEGAKVLFKIKGGKEGLEVFTTRPDTLYGATFMVIAPEHKLVADILEKNGENAREISEYVNSARKKSELERAELQKEKTGIFSGLYAINPVNNKEIPVWISDFVLATYGTGAIMSVPAHDGRDFAFAKKFGLEIVPVIEPETDWDFENEPYVDVNNGKMINSEHLNGLTPDKAIETMISWLVEQGIGDRANSYHLRDWIFSRQHYWGEPIPMVNCEKCGWVPVKEESLPIELPDVENYEPTDTGESPLASMTDWVDTTCPKCGGKAKRETDTMPNWAGSDWYFVRYLDPKNNEKIADMDKMKYWLPVDTYIGGDEHNTLHLLYSRFIYQFLYDLGEVPTPEPYSRRMSHGVILGPNNQRMSKSRGNVVVPNDMIEKVGADALRGYLMFIGPFEGTMAWNENSMMGVKRFVDRLYRFVVNNIDTFGQDSEEVNKITHRTIKAVTQFTQDLQYNTAFAKFMELLNAYEKAGAANISKNSIKNFVIMIAPYMPFLAEQLWFELGESESVHKQAWSQFDNKYLVDSEVEIPVQINGKIRGRIVVGVNEEESVVKAKIEDNSTLKTELLEGDVIKFVYVPGKIVNIVIKKH